jgi:hypothetical protein
MLTFHIHTDDPAEISLAGRALRSALELDMLVGGVCGFGYGDRPQDLSVCVKRNKSSYSAWVCHDPATQAQTQESKT